MYVTSRHILSDMNRTIEYKNYWCVSIYCVCGCVCVCVTVFEGVWYMNSFYQISYYYTGPKHGTHIVIAPAGGPDILPTFIIPDIIIDI